MAIKLDRALRRFRRRSWTVRLVNRVLRSVPITNELADWYNLQDGLKVIAPDAPQTALEVAKAKGREKRALRAIRVMRLVDVADASIGVIGLFRAMFRVFRAKDRTERLEALESDPEQAVDAVLKGLAVSFVVYTLFDGSLTDKVRTFRQTESGQALLTYFATVELGLPFADNVVEAGGNAMQKLLDRFGEGQAERLASILGEQADGALGMAKELFNPKSLVPSPVANLPVVGGSLVGTWDKLAGFAAVGADMLPVYKFLGTRLVAEVSIARGVQEVTGVWPLGDAPAVSAKSLVSRGVAGALTAVGGAAAATLGSSLLGGGSKQAAPALPPPPAAHPAPATAAAPAMAAPAAAAAPVSSNPFAPAMAAAGALGSAAMAAASGGGGAAAAVGSAMGALTGSAGSSAAAATGAGAIRSSNPFAPPPPADPSPSGSAGSPFASEPAPSGPGPFATDAAPSAGSPFAPEPAPSGSPFAPEPAAAGSPFAPEPAPSGSPFAPEPAPSGSPFAPEPVAAAPAPSAMPSAGTLAAGAAAAAAGVAAVVGNPFRGGSAPAAAPAEPAPAPAGSPFAPEPTAPGGASPTFAAITDGPPPPPAPAPRSDLPPVPPTTMVPVWPTQELPESSRLRGAYLSPDGRHWRVFAAEGIFSAFPPATAPPSWDAHWAEGHVTALYKRHQNQVTIEYFDTEPERFTVQPEPYGMRIDREVWRRADFDLTGRTMEGQWFDEKGTPLTLDHDGRISLAGRTGHYRLGLASMRVEWSDRGTDSWSLLSTLTPSSKHPQVLWIAGRRYHRPVS